VNVTQLLSDKKDLRAELIPCMVLFLGQHTYLGGGMALGFDLRTLCLIGKPSAT
jgi:hypothetical protein